jgi:hypothetical protein
MGSDVLVLLLRSWVSFLIFYIVTIVIEDIKFIISWFYNIVQIFFQVVDRHQYGCEVDWWCVGLIMCDMMVGLNRHHPKRYPSYLTKDAESVLRMVSYLSALPVSVMGSLFAILQQWWWAQIVWLDYKLTVFCYFQFRIWNPILPMGTHSYIRSIEEHPFFRTVKWKEVLQKCVTPPIKLVVTVVSTTVPGVVSEV